MEEALQPYVEPEPEKKRWSGRKKITLAVLGGALLVALYFLLPMLLVIFVVQPVKVEGAAMSPTLNSGDKVLISKRIDRLERGDIVVFHYPKDTTKNFIERVVGLPGEKIDIDSDGYIT